MIGNTWQLQEAKNKFSEVVEQAITSGPQIVTKRGIESAVVVSIKDFRAMTQSKRTLVDWLQECPGNELSEILDQREKEEVRELDLS